MALSAMNKRKRLKTRHTVHFDIIPTGERFICGATDYLFRWVKIKILNFDEIQDTPQIEDIFQRIMSSRR